MLGSRPLGTLQEIWRFPIKSMRGESLNVANLLPQGLEGDRVFALHSTAAPHGKPLLSGAERTATLRYTARWQPSPTVTTPDGRTLPLPSPELLQTLQHDLAATGARLSLEASPDDPFFDVRPVSLISLATIHALTEEFGAPIDPLRFRSNLVLALEDDRPFAEDHLIGRTLHLGDADGPQLLLLERIPRCRVVSLDPETTVADPNILRHLARRHEGRLGVYARVVRPGALHLGDSIVQPA